MKSGFMVKCGNRYYTGFRGDEAWTLNIVLAHAFRDRETAEEHAAEFNALRLGNTLAEVVDAIWASRCALLA